MGNVCTSQKSVSAFEPFQNPTEATTSASPEAAPGRESTEHHSSKETTTSQNSQTVAYENASLPAQAASTSADQEAKVEESTALEAQPQAEQAAEASSSEPPPFQPPANYRARRRCSVRSLVLPVHKSMTSCAMQIWQVTVGHGCILWHCSFIKRAFLAP
jgi:hypothetical protein